MKKSKKNWTSTDIKKKKMISALEKTLGVVTSACKIAEVPHSTHYQWLNNDEDYCNAVENIGNIAIDFVETKLFEQIQNRDTTSIIFYLKCKAKNRGYTERQELTGANGERLYNPPKMITKDEAVELLKGLEKNY